MRTFVQCVETAVSWWSVPRVHRHSTATVMTLHYDTSLGHIHTYIACFINSILILRSTCPECLSLLVERSHTVE